MHRPTFFNPKRMCIYLALLAAVFGTRFASATEPLTAEIYVQIEVEVRMLTNAQMQQRVLLQDASAKSKEESMRIAVDGATEIKNVYHAFATTPSAHMAYSTHHAKDIKAWLQAEPDWQQQLDNLQREFDSLVNRFKRNSGD